MTPVDSHHNHSALVAHEARSDGTVAPASKPDDLLSTITRLVGPSQGVLLIGHDVEALTDALRAAGSQVTVASVSRLAGSLNDGRALIEPGETIDFPPAVDGQHYEAAVVVDTLTRLRDPLRLLRTVAQAIAPEGRIIVTVPNAGHGDVRLALWRGESLYAAAGVPDVGDLRLFTRATLIEVCEAAGLVLGQLERLERPVATGAEEGGHASVPGALLEALAQDPDVRTARFVAVAYPLPRPELCFLQERMRELALALAAARREAVELRTATGAAPADQLAKVAHAVASPPETGVPATAPASGDLAVLEQTVREQAEHIAALTVRVESAARREIELRNRLVAAHDQLLRRDDEIQFLRRDHTQSRPAPVFYHQMRGVYARLQWVPGIQLPVRFIRRLKRLVRDDHGRR